MNQKVEVLTEEETRKRDIDLAREKAELIRSSRKGEIGVINQKLPFYGERPGWKRRWVLTSNLPSRMEEGYAFVTRDDVSMKADGIGFGNKDIGNRVAVHAGRGSIDAAGKQEMLYLMEIPMEIAKELDFHKSKRQVAASIDSLKAGNSGGHVKADHNAYVPKDVGISIK